MQRSPQPAGRSPLLIAVALLLCVWAAAASQAGAPRGDRAAELLRVRTWNGPTVDVEGLLIEDQMRRAEGLRPARVGLPMDVALTPHDHGTWTDLADGGRMWRLRVRSAGAMWIVLGFDRFRPPQGAELRVYDPDQRRSLGPFTAADERPDGELWMPPLSGDTLVIELRLPATAVSADPGLRLATVSHGYRSWTGPDAAQSTGPVATAAGSCNIDVNCPLGDPFERERRSVIRLLIGGSALCSGTLVNNTNLDCKGYVLTGDHCYDGGGTAAGTTFLFNYELPACEPGIVPEELTVTGATLRAFYDPSDFHLLELSSSPPGSYDVFYAGWSRSTSPATETWTIHHPVGDLKKISHDEDPPINGIFEGPDHWRAVNWEEGTTEAGSSGAPLLDPDGRIVGQLHTATASCGNPSGWTEFGKFDVSMNNGLSAWLDPAASGVTVFDGIDQEFCGAVAPRLAHDSHVVDDGQDGKADPGETFTLETRLFNDGPATATGVGGTLSTTHPMVSLLDDAATWPDVDPYQAPSTDVPHFEIDLDSGFTCGDSIPLSLSVTANEGSWMSDFLLGTGSAVSPIDPPPFLDDMESGAAGWTTQNLVGATSWAQSADESNSPTTSWHVDNVTGIRDSVLIMPTIASMPAGATLSFAHLMDSSSGDGGVLETTIDGSTWIDAGPWIAAGGRYNSVISTLMSNPLAGRKAWTGDLGGWRTVEVDLSALEGEQATLRWRFGSDTLSGGVGWYVDDVVLDAPTFVCCPESDGDGSCPPPDGGDCDDSDADTYPVAPQICDGVNNDCDDPSWPALSANEIDADSDGVTPCAGDCNGADGSVHPGAAEICDGYDNDCDGLIDNDAACMTVCTPPWISGGAVMLASDPAASTEPALAWNGREHGMVWSDARDGNFEIYFRRVGALGQSPAGDVRVTNATGNSTDPGVVWTGTHYGVTWIDTRGGSPAVYFARLDADGTKVGGDVMLATGVGVGPVALAWTGVEYALAWEETSFEVRFTRIDAAGNPIGTPQRVSNGLGVTRAPVLAWTGSEFGLAWQALDHTSLVQIHFVRVDVAGKRVGPELSVTSGAQPSRRAAIVWGDTQFGVAWNEGFGPIGTNYFTRLNSTGGTVGAVEQITAAATGSGSMDLAWTGGEFGLAWRDIRDGNGEVYFARIDATGTKSGGDLRLSDSPADSSARNVVWSGKDYAVVWGESPDIVFTRIGCSCTDLDDDGITACEDNCPDDWNLSQSDFDIDSEGDVCDIDDGRIHVFFSVTNKVEWQQEQGYDAWNAYKGDMDVLRASGEYTQEPDSNPLAARDCGLGVLESGDRTDPAAGKLAIFLVTGETANVEDDLGQDSSGATRANDNACP